MKRLAVILAALGAVVAAWFRWRPRPEHISGETLADIARREDTSGLGEFNDKDPHPFSVTAMRVVSDVRPPASNDRAMTGKHVRSERYGR